MEAETDVADPFPSLIDLRRANDLLLEKLPDEDSRDAPIPFAAINTFIRRAVETGALLDHPAERRAAQGLIDYLYSSFPEVSARPGKVMSGRFDMALKPFDGERIQSAYRQGDKLIAGLSSKDKELVRRILLNTFVLPEGAASVISAHPQASKLEALGDPNRIRELLDELGAAGVLAFEGDGKWVGPRYEALSRQWPQLIDWIEQRIKFRDASLYWAHSGRKSGALLSSGLWKEAEHYGGLSDIEREFIAASRKRHYLVSSLQAAIAVLLVAIPLAIWMFTTYREEQSKRAAQEKLQAEIANAELTILAPQADQTEKNRALRFLLSNKQSVGFVDFAGNAVEGANFDEVDATGARFIGSRFNNVQFAKATLPFTVFSSARFNNTNFIQSDLELARFDDAAFENTTFTQANLKRSIFDRALFCKNVKFLLSDLRGASVRHVTFAEEPAFVGTAWWLAIGWSVEDFNTLSKQSEGVDYTATEPYKNRLSETDKMFSDAPTNLAKAQALNSKAWHLALYGVSLEEAESASKESLRLYREGQAGSPDRDREGYYLDTLAYILMQTGKMNEALELLKVASERTGGLGSILFRYSIALYATGDKVEAKKLATVAMDEKKYIPSHEWYLLSKRVDLVEFRKDHEELFLKDQSESKRSANECPGRTPTKG